MKQRLQFNTIFRLVVLGGDLCLLNALFILSYHLIDSSVLGSQFLQSIPRILVLLNLVYLLCNYNHGIILHHRIVRPDHIVHRALRNTILHALVFTTLYTLGDFGPLSIRFFLLFYVLFFICLTCYRLTFRILLKWYRKHGGNSRSVILVGADDNMLELCHTMTSDPTYGFRLKGYFAPEATSRYPASVPYLGGPEDVLTYLQSDQGSSTELLFCGLSSSHASTIVRIINYCENHFIHYFDVPRVRNYLKRRMYFELMGNVPVLSIRMEPLSQPENRLVKRTFDVVCSLFFLCTLFPFIYLIVGTAIKLSSPGPVFFKQKRSGLNGREFWCYKFRSMRVNAQSDTLQATLHDPRKTRVGNFLRKSNLDELPQFINVLRGEMSIVGPRPHMLKHTEEYSRLINLYMVRHLVKPGITGWAQVNGFRGETKELWQMEGRVKLDIWYIEHWTFLLDLYILFKTVYNAVKGDKEAY